MTTSLISTLPAFTGLVLGVLLLLLLPLRMRWLVLLVPWRGLLLAEELLLLSPLGSIPSEEVRNGLSCCLSSSIVELLRPKELRWLSVLTWGGREKAATVRILGRHHISLDILYIDYNNIWMDRELHRQTAFFSWPPEIYPQQTMKSRNKDKIHLQ